MRGIAVIVEYFLRIFRLVMRRVVKSKFGRVGRNFRFDPGSIFLNAKLIEVGDNVFIGENAYFSSDNGITIGNEVMFGPYPMIIGGDHNISVVGKLMTNVHTGGVNKPVVIEDDVWIGARVLILKGVTVGEGSVIGAGSVVTRDLPPYVVAYGNPCRVQRPRFSPRDLGRHLAGVGSSIDLNAVLEQWQKHGIDVH